MPVRVLRPRRIEASSYVDLLYRRPALRFLSQEPWADNVSVLIYGPTGKLDAIVTDKLRALWREIGSEILRAQAIHSPGRKPWGIRFDGKGK
jgi:hypothetical protein